MPIMVQVVLDNVSNFQDTLTTNGQPVVQTRTSNQQVVAGINAVTRYVPIAGISACWTSMKKPVATSLADVDVLLVPLFQLVPPASLLLLVPLIRQVNAMPIAVQVVLDNVSNFQDTLTTNGQPVVQTRTSNQQVVADITAVSGSIPIACTSACWRSIAEPVALF